MKKGCFSCLVVLIIAAVLGFFAAPTLKTHLARVLYPKSYSEIVEREAAEFDLDPDLVYAVIKTESHFRPTAKSHAGAMGLMQLTPETFEWIAGLYPPESDGDVLDPAVNIHCGCALLRLLLEQFDSVEVALCAYNAGMGNVSAWLEGGEYSNDGETLHTIPYPETDHYLKKVKKAMARYKEIYTDE